MGHWFKEFKSSCWILASALFALHSWARPPADIILKVEENTQAPNIIRESDITYTNEQPEPTAKKPEYVTKTKYFVMGRSKPTRHGKILEKIPEGSAVLPFRRSSDKKWIAIRIQRSNLRVWVPETSLLKVDDAKFAVNVPEDAASSAKSSGTDSTTEN